MSVVYYGTTLPNAHVSYALPPRMWQIDAFPSGNGEIAQDLGTRGSEITVTGIIPDITSGTDGIGKLKTLDDGKEHTLAITGITDSNLAHVIIVDMLFAEFLTYPLPASGVATKAARYSIKFRRLI